MATKTNINKSKNESSEIIYPKNLTAQGILSFPLWNDKDKDERLPEWRQSKGHKPGDYDDRLGGTFFLTKKMVDHIAKYLLEVYLPFTIELNEKTGGKKGFTPEEAEALEQNIRDEDWSEQNLPIKDLSKTDAKNVDDDIVAKFVFYASGGNEISKKLMGKDGAGNLMTLEFGDVEGIPDTDALWWGARNTFRGAFNLNNYVRVIGKIRVPGITAYTRSLHLRSDLPMNWGGGTEDVEALLEDDFED